MNEGRTLVLDEVGRHEPVRVMVPSAIPERGAATRPHLGHGLNEPPACG